MLKVISANNHLKNYFQIDKLSDGMEKQSFHWTIFHPKLIG